jgi:hypothetical protein
MGNENEAEKDQCSNCRFWLPKYYAVGICGRQHESQSKMFTIGSVSSGEHAPLMTINSFLCSEYEPQKPTSAEIL